MGNTLGDKAKDVLYFKSTDDTICSTLESHLADAVYEGLGKITLIKAVPDSSNPDYVWCLHYGECIERHQCKKSQCGYYSSKSGRGVCKHRGDLYQHGEEVVFDVPKDFPNELEPVLALINHNGELGFSEWYEVVYYYNTWVSYAGSKTFKDGEVVVKWKYCKDLL